MAYWVLHPRLETRMLIILQLKFLPRLVKCFYLKQCDQLSSIRLPPIIFGFNLYKVICVQIKFFYIYSIWIFKLNFTKQQFLNEAPGSKFWWSVRLSGTDMSRVSAMCCNAYGVNSFGGTNSQSGFNKWRPKVFKVWKHRNQIKYHG